MSALKRQPIEMVHSVCGLGLQAVIRTVHTQPDDKCWPRDLQTLVPYCRTCETVVPITEVLNADALEVR